MIALAACAGRLAERGPTALWTDVTAAVALVLTSAIGRLQAKYGTRGYRFGLFDVGHVSEDIYLAGTGLGLQVCATAGFIDEEVDRTLGLDGLERATMLVLLIGPASSE